LFLSPRHCQQVGILHRELVEREYLGARLLGAPVVLSWLEPYLSDDARDFIFRYGGRLGGKTTTSGDFAARPTGAKLFSES
jgi:hypothetical protein